MVTAFSWCRAALKAVQNTGSSRLVQVEHVVPPCGSAWRRQLFEHILGQERVKTGATAGSALDADYEPTPVACVRVLCKSVQCVPSSHADNIPSVSVPFMLPAGPATWANLAPRVANEPASDRSQPSQLSSSQAMSDAAWPDLSAAVPSAQPPPPRPSRSTQDDNNHQRSTSVMSMEHTPSVVRTKINTSSL